MGRYQMDMTPEGFMGEGAFSTCRKGKCNETGEAVAIKFFKVSAQSSQSGPGSINPTELLKLNKQISVMEELQQPFVQPADPRLWCPELAKVKPDRLFMRLIDYTKDSSGQVGADTKDGVPYVITELAQYSLKDFLSMRIDSMSRSKELQPLSKETVKSITKAILLVMGGLHAKGMVHLDLKPENMMVFNGYLKLIDMDGCMKIGSVLRIDDPTISFTPLYCAPEWAHFVAGAWEPGGNGGVGNTVEARPGLDVWSVGCTICEIVTLCPLMMPMYANLTRHAREQNEACFLFLHWLESLSAWVQGDTRNTLVSQEIQSFDSMLGRFLIGSLFVGNADTRKTCAECLADPYMAGSKFHRSQTNPLTHAADEDDKVDMPELVPRQPKRSKPRMEDLSNTALHTGVLWKLNHGEDPKDIKNWIERDMWIGANGSLCYYSKANEKRLVLLDSHHLYGATITSLTESARNFAFQVQAPNVEHAGEEVQTFAFAGPSAEDTSQWLKFLRAAARKENVPTMRFGPGAAKALQEYKLSVKNRRLKVEPGDIEGVKPVFEGRLWKVKAAGDGSKDSDWFERDVWLSRNGSLVYYSPKDKRELVYYTAADLHGATVVSIPEGKSLKPWAFQVTLQPHDGLEFAPGQFAAESESMRDMWIEVLAQASRRYNICT